MQPMQPPPMQPFRPFPPDKPQPKGPKAPLSGTLKLILGLKLISVLFVMGGVLLVLMAGSEAAKPTDAATRNAMHQLANLALMAMGASFVELIGIAGTWSMKRWGVYTLMGFSFLNIAVRLSAHDNASAGFSALTTLLVGIMIAPRWNDFD